MDPPRSIGSHPRSGDGVPQREPLQRCPQYARWRAYLGPKWFSHRRILTRKTSSIRHQVLSRVRSHSAPNSAASREKVDGSGVSSIPSKVLVMIPWPVAEKTLTPYEARSNFCAPFARKFFANLRRISSCVLRSPKSARRKRLPLPGLPENAENAFKRAPEPKKRKSPAIGANANVARQRGWRGHVFPATSH